jgi:hypothetical protein
LTVISGVAYTRRRAYFFNPLGLRVAATVPSKAMSSEGGG